MRAYTGKEQRGLKTHIKMQCIKVTPKSIYAVMQFPKYLQPKLYKFSFRSHKAFFVAVKDIDTRDRLAFVINKHYGYGTWLICFWDILKPNKYFKHKFKCKGDKCYFRSDEYHGIRRCNYRFFNLRYGVRGWSCPMNPKNAPNWSVRAKIEIYPKDSIDIQFAYGYRWHKEYDLMHRFSRFFWKGK